MINNQIQIPLEQLANLMKHAVNWELKDGIFNEIIADDTQGKFEEVMKNLQPELQNQQVTVKAGKRDKNGNIPANGKLFRFIVPAVSQDEQFFFNIIPPNQQPNNNFFGYGLAGVQKQQQQPQDLGTLIGEIENRLTAKFQNDFKKQVWEIEEMYRRKELERKEQEIQDKLDELQEKIDLYEEKVNKFMPDTGDVLKGLFNFGKSLISKDSSEVSGLKEEEKEKVKKGSKLKFSFKKQEEEQEEEETEQEEPEQEEENETDI